MFKTFVFLSLVASGYSAVHFQKFVEKPAELANQDGCYIPELLRVLPYDAPFRPEGGKPCARYVCSRNNETQVDTCGNAMVPDGCKRFLPPADELTAENCCGVLKCN